MKHAVMSTDQLVEAIHIANSKGYNRRLSSDMIYDLDPQGIHIIGMSVLTNDPYGQDVVRCEMYMKFRNDDEPNYGWLDMDLDKFNKLDRITP